MKNVKNIITAAFVCTLLASIAFAEPSIKISNVGHGRTPGDVYLTIANTGDTVFNAIEVFVDGAKYKDITLKMGSGGAIRSYVRLQPGKHLIEVRTPDGAYDSINLSIEKSTLASTTTTVAVTTTTARGTTTPSPVVWTFPWAAAIVLAALTLLLVAAVLFVGKRGGKTVRGRRKTAHKRRYFTK